MGSGPTLSLLVQENAEVASCHPRQIHGYAKKHNMAPQNTKVASCHTKINTRLRKKNTSRLHKKPQYGSAKYQTGIPPYKNNYTATQSTEVASSHQNWSVLLAECFWSRVVLLLYSTSLREFNDAVLL
jgi:hypothetical protein